MKYVVLQPDGVADHPLAQLDGRTPLQAARTPHMDWLARHGVFGLTYPIPPGFPPGSDVGNMSVLGYDPALYHTGRSPLEAASLGVALSADDIAFRCNLVSLAENGAVMEDFTAGHISSEEAALIIRDLQKHLGRKDLEFHPGVSYRHLIVWRKGREGMTTVPPHDITGQAIANYLPRGEGADLLLDLMCRAQPLLARHPVNTKRKERGQRQANAIWLWGQGRAPVLPSLKERFGVNGGVIAAVDIINGLGVYTGLERVPVPGITGFLDTNYQGKGDYAARSLAEKDFIFVHVEATDEAGHMGDADSKIKAIEAFDEKVVGTILRGMERWPDWRLLLVSDHATPVAVKTHVPDPVPFVLFDTARKLDGGKIGYNEADAARTGVIVKKAHLLMEALIEGREPWIET
jgi:2,3-bisphosphoglycerate-independent phosphoglycerate mutase